MQEPLLGGARSCPGACGCAPRSLAGLPEARPTGFEPVNLRFRRPRRMFGGARLGTGLSSITGPALVWVRLGSARPLPFCCPALTHLVGWGGQSTTLALGEPPKCAACRESGSPSGPRDTGGRC